MLIKANNGTRNQKKGSRDPSKRSFRAKSTGDSVAFLAQLIAVEADGAAGVPSIADVKARKVKRIISTGREDRRQRPKESAKGMNTP